MLQTFYKQHVFNRSRRTRTYFADSNDFSFVVVTVCNVSTFLGGNGCKFGNISCNMLGTSTADVPLLPRCSHEILS